VGRMIAVLLILWSTLSLAAPETGPPTAVDPDDAPVATAPPAATPTDTDVARDADTADTDPPLDTDPPDTDPPADTDVPTTVEEPIPPGPRVDLDWPEGWDAFVGPMPPPPGEVDEPPTEEADSERHTDDGHTDDGHTDDGHTDEPAADATDDTDAAHTDETHGDAHGDGAHDPEQDTDGPAVVDVPEDSPPDRGIEGPHLQPFLPSLPLRGIGPALALTFLTGLCWILARALGPVREWLAPTGALPVAATTLQQVLRVLALFFGFGVLAAIVPANLEPALPWVVLAGAVALGWSTRDVAPDFVAGLLMAAERKIRPGRWIDTGTVSGVVEQVGLRVTWVVDATGRRVVIPNRTFLSGIVATDRGQWPSIEVVLRVPGEHTPSAIRRVLEDAVLVSPWTAPLPPEMVREEQEAGLWRVRARVLEGRFADRFEGALREHVEEALTVDLGLRDRMRSTRPRQRWDVKPEDPP